MALKAAPVSLSQSVAVKTVEPAVIRMVLEVGVGAAPVVGVVWLAPPSTVLGAVAVQPAESPGPRDEWLAQPQQRRRQSVAIMGIGVISWCVARSVSLGCSTQRGAVEHDDGKTGYSLRRHELDEHVVHSGAAAVRGRCAASARQLRRGLLANVPAHHAYSSCAVGRKTISLTSTSAGSLIAKATIRA